MDIYQSVSYLHIASVWTSIGLFVLRFFWLYSNPTLLQRRWVRIAPHIIDTLLLASGVALILITHFYPFAEEQSWLTEKLFGVIIYILLGHIALGKRTRSHKIRWLAFIFALVCIYLIFQLTHTKLPLLMG
ncbi:siroheme synthase [Affinibrenneria salicis]|uniref:Siroheme synthase n=1 Tax=Affinibrenneria salicis TaxID=2590031 RepID=A0A5J5G4W4_9GAMM|nr:SirB2 family protein [Affinibrenneria salicis]KAA9001904.1 siroheme synthase [Affinibrenneria salicis]